jgi:hypothetical protein
VNASATRLAAPSTARRGYGLVFAVGAVLMIAGVIATDSAESFIGYALMTTACLLPVLLWMLAGASGLPVLPMISCLYYFYYALPILRTESGIAVYSPSEVLDASITVTLFLAAATLAWQAILSTRDRREKVAEAEIVTPSQLTRIIFFGLGLGLFYFVALLSGYLVFFGSLFGLLRAILLAATSVSSFLLGHAAANGFIRGGKLIFAVSCLTVVVLLSWSSLFLVEGMIYVLAALFGYMITSRRIPWVTVAVVGAIVTVLHAGKGEMRQRYWEVNSNYTMQMSIFQVPEILADWVVTGVDTITSGNNYSSAIDRASLLKLLMCVERLAPNHVPFLEGETYSYLPYMLVPRFIQEDKMFSQASMTLLNIRFGFQTEQAASVTAIGWGLVAEAYANYGNIAAVLVGLFIGLFTGLLTRWSQGAAILSAPTLVTIAAMMIMVNAEADFSYLFTSLFQGCASILIFLVAFNSISGMRKQAAAARRATVAMKFPPAGAEG